MTLSQYKPIAVLLFILIPLLYACGGEEVEKIEGNNEVVQTPALATENTMQTNQENQKKIEQEATKSLTSITTAGNFAVKTQRMVTVDLHFLTTQFQEKISIYSTLDLSSNTPINLLEQGTIHKSNSYKTMLAAATALDFLIVVRNDDFSKSIVITINSDDLLTHTFQE